MNAKTKNIVRNVLGVILGIIIGGSINALIVSIGGSVIPPVEGMNPNDLESIKAHMHLFEFKHFLMPWLAHAIGSLIAGLVAALIAGSHKMILATVSGGFFIIGGVMMVFSIPTTPTWFIFVDLILAYIPMGWLGGKLAGNRFPASK